MMGGTLATGARHGARAALAALAGGAGVALAAMTGGPGAAGGHATRSPGASGAAPAARGPGNAGPAPRDPGAVLEPGGAARPDPNTVLAVEDLWVEFAGEEGTFAAVRGVSFRVRAGETVALVGESGCGKSVTALSIMRLLPEPQARIRRGRIEFEGLDLARAGEREMRRVRGNRIAMVFQEPMTSLNPVYTCGEQVAEAIRVHRRCSRREARALALEAFRQVGISDPERRLDQYPHELSGGLRQRVMIAMAVACRPRLLIADEPTTALDVTIQAQILDLMRELRDRLGTSILFITHDLGVVAEMADRVVVMYAGEVVEEGPVREIFREPRHPYTAGLLRSIPRRDTARKTPLPAIEGAVPHPSRRPPGCAFAPRCPRVMDHCRQDSPPWREVGPGQGVRCWLYAGPGEGAGSPAAAAGSSPQRPPAPGAATPGRPAGGPADDAGGSRPAGGTAQEGRVSG